MYALLTAAGQRTPVPGNAEGSYLTFRSLDALLFGVISIAGDFAVREIDSSVSRHSSNFVGILSLQTVFLDQAYWQRAIASEPKTCVKAFLLGGSAWLSVPLGFATALGLVSLFFPSQNQKSLY